MARPFQNAFSRKTKDMNPAVTGQAYRSVRRDLPEADEEAPQEIKSPWVRRVLKRRGLFTPAHRKIMAKELSDKIDEDTFRELSGRK